MTTSKKVISIVESTFAIVLSTMMYFGSDVDAKRHDREERQGKKTLSVELLPTDVSKPCPTFTLKGYADRDITMVRRVTWHDKVYGTETYNFEKGEDWQVEALRVSKSATVYVRVDIYNKNGKLLLQESFPMPGAGLCAQN
jgi:hypothetical protein